MREILAQEQRLLRHLAQLGSVVVAYSGGVDSAVVAAAAFRAVGVRALAVTGVSASLPAIELEHARQLASQIGIRHCEVSTDELQNPEYARNDGRRCFHCKTELYSHLVPIATAEKAVIVNGTNTDDLVDFRPGLQAARDLQIDSPLVACGFTKADVRALARAWELPVWDKPASPCLSSRIAYGEEVTPERLSMIERAESFLRELGLSELRVRYHRGDLARVEVPPTEIVRLADPGLRREITQQLRRLGFQFVTLDLDGFRSGSLNVLVELGGAR